MTWLRLTDGELDLLKALAIPAETCPDDKVCLEGMGERLGIVLAVSKVVA